VTPPGVAKIWHAPKTSRRPRRSWRPIGCILPPRDRILWTLAWQAVGSEWLVDLLQGLVPAPCGRILTALTAASREQTLLLWVQKFLLLGDDLFREQGR
jgi:hypothetical protein